MSLQRMADEIQDRSRFHETGYREKPQMYKEGDQVELTVGETTLVGRIESLGPLDDELILLIGVAEGDTASLPDGAELKVNSKDRAYVFGRGRMIGGPVALDVRVTELHD